ncbi:ATP-binding protein [Streptomyces xiamenensis]|uniref:ATP-binding protein n=1 Tax=Streptomyces xiamenensis TaxID=408015 RepID=UPI0036E4AD28
MFTPLTTLPLRHVLTLPTDVSAVRMARETAETAWTEWGINPHHPTIGPALLILTELVTNTIRHAATHSPQLTIIYAAAPDRLALAVHDRHPHQPPLHTTASATRGRGLTTVMELTDQLGGTAFIRPDDDGRGKGIWITLPLEDPKAAPDQGSSAP